VTPPFAHIGCGGTESIPLKARPATGTELFISCLLLDGSNDVKERVQDWSRSSVRTYLYVSDATCGTRWAMLLERHKPDDILPACPNRGSR
jgi:hypothetical protein